MENEKLLIGGNRLLILNITFFLLFPMIILGQDNEGSFYDFLIKNATVIDGTGSEGFKAHVLIQNDEIVRIEKDISLDFSAKREIDASGLILSP